MKFMKLGTRPDTFFTSDSGRTVSSEIATDVVIQVQDTRFLLHKFPLLSKCYHLKRLLLEPPLAQSPLPPDAVVELSGFPGGAPAFELCAKFCYGVTITLCAGNIVAARCAAEYLQMSDEMEKGNLAGKLESFLKSCLLRRWKDSLVVLQSNRKLPLLSEELGITSCCIDAIASSILANPTRPNIGRWWVEDISELGIDHFWRIMATVKSAEKIPVKITGKAVMVYARRWLPRVDTAGLDTKRQQMFLEKIVSLIPAKKGSVPCGFLLRLLKAANLLNSSASTKAELARRAGIQLEEATVGELLIPSSSGTSSTVYDVDLVVTMLEEFLLQGQQSPPESPMWKKPVEIERRRSRSAEEVEFECGRRSSSVSSHGSKLKVAKIIDGYLQEIAGDANLQLEKLVSIAEAVPEFARADHDGLYHAINTYLKAHPDLNKSDRKRLCRVLDCKKLSVESCTHAAQNEMLPLRVVVQVLFFDQARLSVSSEQAKEEVPGSLEAILVDTVGGKNTDEWSIISNVKLEKPNIATLKMKLEENDDLDDEGDYGGNRGLMRNSSARLKSLCSIPNKPKMLMNKIWSLNRSVSHRR